MQLGLSAAGNSRAELDDHGHMTLRGHFTNSYHNNGNICASSERITVHCRSAPSSESTFKMQPTIIKINHLLFNDLFHPVMQCFQGRNLSGASQDKYLPLDPCESPAVIVGCSLYVLQRC